VAIEVRGRAELERLAQGLKTKFDTVGVFCRPGRTDPPISCCNQADVQCGDDPMGVAVAAVDRGRPSVKGKHKFVYTYEGSTTDRDRDW
jgi:hypothetical protein